MKNTVRGCLMWLSLAILTLGGTDALAADAGCRIKVMSFNMRFDTPKDTGDLDWSRRQQPIARMLAETGPDIVGAQEVLHSMTASLYSQNPQFGHYSLKPEKEDSVSDRMTGNTAILYRLDRFEALDSGYFWLSATPEKASRPWDSTDRHYRTAVWLKLRDKRTSKDFYFFSTHFPYKKAPIDTKVRAQCAKLICDKIKEIAGDGATVFVTGDMNASDNNYDPRSASLDPYFDYMKAARREAEFTNKRSSFNGFGRVSPEIRGKNLDHIFYRNATPRLFETVDYPGYGVTYISDHYPIMCHFDL